MANQLITKGVITQKW